MESEGIRGTAKKDKPGEEQVKPVTPEPVEETPSEIVTKPLRVQNDGEDEPQPDRIARLEEMVNQLTAKLDEVENVAEARGLEVLELQREINRVEVAAQERVAAGEIVEPEADIIHDPYEGHNAFAILKEIPEDDEFPKGQILGWKNPDYRSRRNWRGWIPIEYGDKYAGKNNELLTEYLVEAPERMVGPDAIDNYVRRGDVVLARLDKRIAESRARKRVIKSRRKAMAASQGGIQVLRDGVELVGEGATRARNPRKEFTTAPPTPTREDGRDVARTRLPITRAQE